MMKVALQEHTKKMKEENYLGINKNPSWKEKLIMNLRMRREAGWQGGGENEEGDVSVSEGGKEGAAFRGHDLRSNKSVTRPSPASDDNHHHVPHSLHTTTTTSHHTSPSSDTYKTSKKEEMGKEENNEVEMNPG